tara:strand:+ start:97 stop:486 length:390 start_codon:yes stop_codon:yes gene_type:complete
MANHTGSEGVVKIGANTVAEVRSYSIELTGDTIEDTAMGDAARTFKAGLTSWSGSVDCYHDETDSSGQMAMDPGSSVTLNLYPEGDTSADTYFTGTVFITSRSVSASLDGMVEASYGFQGTGALSEATV